ncbi:unnamed protein product [Protopolystoma xenopodis]|uniref:Uncharacterized protein n=1 Tax=Protopolystoma xenopodis TaxID=117903 RepID=A0A3S4ZXG5_9PLAT|nr:unnamed protein product [Protopolystoma xenopodis]
MFKFYKRCAKLADLQRRHHTYCLPSSSPFQVADPALVSCPDLPHGPAGPFLLFLVDQFHSDPDPVYLYSRRYFSNLL